MVHKIAVLLPLIGIAIVVGALGLVIIPPGIKNAPTGFTKGTIRINHDVISVEVANTSAEKERWLMFRNDRMPLDSAMILVYDKPDLYSMWLLNIQYNLDLIWFDENGYAIYMVKNVSPCKSTFDIADCTYKNTEPAKYVIAATAGFIDKHQIDKNSRMVILSI